VRRHAAMVVRRSGAQADTSHWTEIVHLWVSAV
jgi:hypothetical protein